MATLRLAVSSTFLRFQESQHRCAGELPAAVTGLSTGALRGAARWENGQHLSLEADDVLMDTVTMKPMMWALSGDRSISIGLRVRLSRSRDSITETLATIPARFQEIFLRLRRARALLSSASIIEPATSAALL